MWARASHRCGEQGANSPLHLLQGHFLTFVFQFLQHSSDPLKLLRAGHTQTQCILNTTRVVFPHVRLFPQSESTKGMVYVFERRNLRNLSSFLNKLPAGLSGCDQTFFMFKTSKFQNKELHWCCMMPSITDHPICISQQSEQVATSKLFQPRMNKPCVQLNSRIRKTSSPITMECV